MRDPAAELDLKIRNELVRMAIKRLMGRFEPATLQIFQLQVVDGWDVDQVARLHNKSAAAVYMIRHRLVPAVREELRKLQGEAPLKVEEFDPAAMTDTCSRSL